MTGPKTGAGSGARFLTSGLVLGRGQGQSVQMLALLLDRSQPPCQHLQRPDPPKGLGRPSMPRNSGMYSSWVRREPSIVCD